MDNLLSYCGLVDSRISTSGKDLPVRSGENLAKKVPARHGTSVSLVIQTISCRIKT